MGLVLIAIDNTATNDKAAILQQDRQYRTATKRSSRGPEAIRRILSVGVEARRKYHLSKEWKMNTFINTFKN